MICEPSRLAALRQLEDFVSIAGSYGRDRNHVKPGHPSVSRLSPAIRHRLITEEEVAAAVMRAHPFGRVEKFVQEVYWRRYWKSWLALRPEVWSDYLAGLNEIGENPAVRQVEESRTGNRVIDHFATELVSTGYLHNHARMWFAAWWVHEARLPWQSGAAFFFRHLLDGDPASNTLSWRWVAGLQTPGKTYLARRGNLEKYLAPELLAGLAESLDAFENPQPLQPGPTSKPPVTWQETTPDRLDLSVPTGLWIHEEDLSVETLLGQQTFATIAVTADVETWVREGFPLAKREWISEALRDAASRAEEVWKISASLEIRTPHTGALLQWAKAMNLQQVVALRPEVGPLHDSLPLVKAALAAEGVRLVLVDRAEDLRIRPFATGGFFPFWDRLRKTLLSKLPSGGGPEPQILMDFTR